MGTPEELIEKYNLKKKDVGVWFESKVQQPMQSGSYITDKDVRDQWYEDNQNWELNRGEPTKWQKQMKQVYVLTQHQLFTLLNELKDRSGEPNLIQDLQVLMAHWGEQVLNNYPKQ